MKKKHVDLKINLTELNDTIFSLHFWFAVSYFTLLVLVSARKDNYNCNSEIQLINIIKLNVIGCGWLVGWYGVLRLGSHCWRTSNYIPIFVCGFSSTSLKLWPSRLCVAHCWLASQFTSPKEHECELVSNQTVSWLWRFFA